MSTATPTTASGVEPILPTDFDVKNIRFESCVWKDLPDNKGKYGRAGIKYQLPNGSLVPLNLLGPCMSTYGVGENKDDKTQEVTGYSVCFQIPKGGKFEFVIAQIHMACCQYLVDNWQKCGVATEPITIDTAKHLLKAPALYPKDKTTNMVDTSKERRMYSKLIYYGAKGGKPERMITVFDNATAFDPKTGQMETVDPRLVRSNVDLMPTVLFESIYFGAKASMQIKLPRAAIIRAGAANSVSSSAAQVSAYMASNGLVGGPRLDFNQSTTTKSVPESQGGDSPATGEQKAGSDDPATML